VTIDEFRVREFRILKARGQEERARIMSEERRREEARLVKAKREDDERVLFSLKEGPSDLHEAGEKAEGGVY
jgi:hypothetical protein